MSIIICNNGLEDSTERNLPKIYLCCNPKDFDLYFEKIKNEIRAFIPKVQFWYCEEEEIPDLDELSCMNLFVVIVTKQFLKEAGKSKASCYQALQMAKELKLPMLPIIQSGVLDEEYKELFGTIQYLTKAKSGSYGLSYEEKLKKRLKDTILDSEEIERICNAFLAKIFLSYRKVDRKYVGQIMRAIHENDAFRDVGIWYDEFLKPGENFDREIEKELLSSEVFALAITPNILKYVDGKPNYVMGTEYPKAIEENREVLPIACENVDEEELKESFKGIDHPIFLTNVKAIHEVLEKKFGGSFLTKKNEDADHVYYIGLAYLFGINAEKNASYAVALLEQAADMGLSKAYEKLVSIYNQGDNVEKDPDKAVEWQRKYVEKLKTENRNDTAFAKKLFEEVFYLANLVFGRIKLEEAENIYKEALLLYEALSFDAKENMNQELLNLYNSLGDMIRMQVTEFGGTISNEKIKEVKEYYRKALALCEKIGSEAAIVYQYSQLAHILLVEAKAFDEQSSIDMTLVEEAADYNKKAILYYDGIKEEDQTIDSYRNTSIVFDRMAEICLLQKDLDGALAYFEKSLRIWELLYRDNQSKYFAESYLLAITNYATLLSRKDALHKANNELIKANRIMNQLLEGQGMTTLGIKAGCSLYDLLCSLHKHDAKKFKENQKKREYFEAWYRQIVR